MKSLYFDTIAGISGDMTVGALIALGVPLEVVEEAVRKLPIDGYSLRAERRFVSGIAAVKFDVAVEGDDHHVDHDAGHPHGHSHHHHDPAARIAHGHRRYADIRTMIERSELDDRAKHMALAIFARLAAAEARVHGVTTDDVSFHEVGAVDSIVDIVGAAAGFAHLDVGDFQVGEIPLGSGVIRSQHGMIPVPAPATIELLEGFTTRFGDGAGELVTPTGAAIVAALVRPASASTSVAFVPERVGYGSGTRQFADRPNLLRLVLGRRIEAGARADVVVLECNLDDTTPEILGYAMERLLEAGALDVAFTPIFMKKNRPATMLSVVAAPADVDRLAAIVLAETSTLGVRIAPQRRMVLPRSIRSVATEFGAVRVKVARTPDGRMNIAPEYEDCRRIAAERAVALKHVVQAALAAGSSIVRSDDADEAE